MADDNIKSHKKLGLHPLSRSYIFGITTAGGGGRGGRSPSGLRVKVLGNLFVLSDQIKWNCINKAVVKIFSNWVFLGVK